MVKRVQYRRIHLCMFQMTFTEHKGTPCVWQFKSSCIWMCNYICVRFSKRSLLKLPDQTWEAKSAFKHGKILYHTDFCLYSRHKYQLQSGKEMEDMIILWVLLDPLAPGPLEALSDPGKIMKKNVKIGLALSCIHFLNHLIFVTINQPHAYNKP